MRDPRSPELRSKDLIESLLTEVEGDPVKPDTEPGFGTDPEKVSEIGIAAAKSLTDSGVEASWEYPGFIWVSLTNGDVMSVGDVNGYWGFDITTEDGYQVDHDDAEIYGFLEKLEGEDPSTVSVEDLVTAIIQIHHALKQHTR